LFLPCKTGAADRAVAPRTLARRDAAQVIESYAYDATGNRTSWTNGSESFSASYDDQDRLLPVTPSSGPSLTYTYSAAGMLRTKKQSGQTVTTTYDDFGNLLRVDTADGIAVGIGGRGRRRCRRHRRCNHGSRLDPPSRCGWSDRRWDGCFGHVRHRC
jgi:YD repeat-containing protein